jgi:hypothetical protein
MAPNGIQCPFEVEGVKSFSHFEEITFTKIRDQFNDMGFFDTAALFAKIGCKFTHLFDDETRVSVEFFNENFACIGIYLNTQFESFILK